jgi:hypothetical protein
MQLINGQLNLYNGLNTSGSTIFTGSVSVTGSLYSNGFTIHDGTISGSQPANNPSSSLMLISGSILPASGSTAGGSVVLLNTVMSASANNQTLVGLDINPTFNNGGFTGVNLYGIRVTGAIVPSVSAAYSLGAPSFNFSQTHTRQFLSSGTNGFEFYPSYTIKSAQWFTTGNLVLQNGGTFTDNGYKLQINASGSLSGSLLVSGSSVFQNATTSSDGGVLGPELTTASGWVSGSDWTGVYNSFTHISGSGNTPLTSSLAAVNGNNYAINYTIATRNSGSITLSYGGLVFSGATTSGTAYGKATSTALLYVTPTADFDGTVSLSVKQVTAGSANTTFQNSSGTANIEVRASGVSNTNTFIGLNSGRYNVTGGTQNTSLGSGALASILTANNNTAIGYNAGTLITTGGSNTLIGSNAGTAITTGTSNTLIGSSAGSGNTIGAGNIAIGNNNLGANTTGNYNIAIGGQQVLSSVNSSSNIAIGFQSFSNLSSGGGNTLVGTQAGRVIADGVTALTSATNGVYLGNQVRAGVNGETNAIVIGNAAIGLGSNTTVIGNSSTTVTGLYGNLVLVGSGSANLMTGSATGSGYTLNIAGPSTNGALLVSGSTTMTGSLNVTGSILQNGGALAVQDGTTLYHTEKWFYPSSSINVTGSTVNISIGQFTSGMVSAKLTISGESKIITAYTSSTQVIVDSAYSQNYSSVTASNWGVYSRSYVTKIPGLPNYQTTRIFDRLGQVMIGVDDNIIRFTYLGEQSLNSVSMDSTGFQLGGSRRITWTNSTSGVNEVGGAKDLGIRRNTTGSLEIYDGNTADGAVLNRRDLIVRDITGSNAIFSGSVNVTGSLFLNGVAVSTGSGAGNGPNTFDFNLSPGAAGTVNFIQDTNTNTLITANTGSMDVTIGGTNYLSVSASAMNVTTGSKTANYMHLAKYITPGGDLDFNI